MAGGAANDLTVQGGVMYVVWNGDLRLYDITTPSAPSRLSTTSFGGARHVVVRNQRAQIAVSTSPGMGELVTVNCTNPSSPAVVNTIGVSGDPVGMAVRPGVLALESSDPGVVRLVRIFDLSSPATPALESVFVFSGDENPGAALDLGQSQGVNMGYWRDLSGGIFPVNLSNLGATFEVPAPLTDPVTCIAANSVDGVFASGNGVLRSYTSHAWTGLRLAGTTDRGPADPVATLRIGDHVVCATGRGFMVYEVSNPAAPSLVVPFGLVDQLNDAVIDGTSLFTLANRQSLQFRHYDMSNPAAPMLVGLDDLSSYGHDLDVEGTLACVATVNTLDVYSVENSNSINRLSRVQMTETPDRVILRETTAIVQTESGILFYDLADPNVPVQFSTIATTAGTFVDMAIRDDILFVMSSSGRLQAFDIANPANPQRRGVVEIGSTGSLSLADSLVVVSRPSSYEAVIIDWADPSSPVVLPQTFRTADAIPPKCGVGLDGSLFVMTETNGVETYDLPGNPRVAQQPRQAAACVSTTQVQFSVGVAEPAGTTYRWRKNGTPLVGGTTSWGTTISGVFSSTLTLANPRVQDLASYDCVVTNGCGTATTRLAALVPGFVPNVVIPPADVQVYPRGETTLSVGWLGTTPATFQWQAEFPAGSGMWTNLSDGAISRTFIEGAQTRFLTVGASAGLTMNSFAQTDYRCIITNTCGATTSSAGSIRLCIGDFDCSGSPDGDDVIAFFADWDSNLAGADVDESGGVDGDDVIIFFGAWDSGC